MFYFLYVRMAAFQRQGEITMTLIRSLTVDPDIVSTTQCELNYACLSGKAVCDVERYEYRDVQLLRCRDERSCAYRKNYQGLSICTCPVNRASAGIN